MGCIHVRPVGYGLSHISNDILLELFHVPNILKKNMPSLEAIACHQDRKEGSAPSMPLVVHAA
jgi:hypothetical protein